MFDLNAPATLTWTSKEVVRERHLGSVKDAVRIAMKELTRAEFFSAHVRANDESYAGDQIVQIFRSGTLTQRRYARF